VGRGWEGGDSASTAVARRSIAAATAWMAFTWASTMNAAAWAIASWMPAAKIYGSDTNWAVPTVR